MSEDDLIWAALADSKRRQIVRLLEEKPRTTSEISDFFDVSRFAVMRHLKVLEQANLITMRREGRQRWNMLNSEFVDLLRTKLVDDGVESPHRLAEILGLFPGRKRDASASTSSTPVEVCLTLHATPDRVFKAVTSDVDSWWSQRDSKESHVCMEPYVNGRFFEAFNEVGQGILYGTVTYIKQDEEIRLKGTMGWQDRAAETPARDGFIRITLTDEQSATRLSVSHSFDGAADHATRLDYQRRWKDLLERHLKPFIEETVAQRQLV